MRLGFRTGAVSAALAAALFISAPAHAQSVQQGGPWTSRHVPVYVPGGGFSTPFVQDEGPAGGGPLNSSPGVSELLRIVPGVNSSSGPTANSGTGPYNTNDCNYDAPPSGGTGGFHYLCFSPNAQGGGLLAYGPGGGAGQLPFNFIINGATYKFPFAPTGSVTGFPTPQSYGCVGNGVADDTACLQNAINTTAGLGIPLVFDSQHLYKTTSALTISTPIDIEGAYRFGEWVTQSTNASYCPWGIINTTNSNIIQATAVTGTIRNLCIQAGAGTGNVGSNSSATAGAAIQLQPPSTITYQTGWHIEGNTILGPYDGITINGAGYSASCCGAGTTVDGVTLWRNTIVNPADIAISIGKNTANAGTVGITAIDNAINCENAASKASGIGLALFDGAIWYDGTQIGPEACNIGVEIIPGTVSGQGQNAQIDAKGVLGDQNGSHDLLIQPQTSLGTVGFSEFENIWAANSTDTNEILISNTNSGMITNLSFIGGFVHTGPNQTNPAFDVETSSSGGGFNNLVINGMSIDCWDSTTCTLGLKINSSVSGQPSYVSVNGNRFGASNPSSGIFTTAMNINTNPGGSFIQVNGNVVKATTGLTLTTPSSVNVSDVGVTGNNFGGTTTPISYTPNSADVVTIANNVGVDTACPSVAVSSNSITIPNANNCLVISTGGTPSVNNIGPPWVGREIELQTAQSGGFTTTTGGSPYPMCNAVTVAQSQVLRLLWRAGGTCWTNGL